MRLWAVLVLLLSCEANVNADEGMWLFNDPPRAKLKEKYGFNLTDAWLDRAMKASIRFNNGGSGSFVSPRGLIVTNHHIGADSLQKLTSPERNLMQYGFCAPTMSDELKCPDLELNVLQSIEDVTARVEAGVKAGLRAAEAVAARRAVMAAIEKESLDQTGLRSDVVTLYQGGLYHLYRYKKYTDIRLVFAPESRAAAFGGDVDNFEFPRFGFDVCFVRAYENGEPAKVANYFPWATKFPVEGDLVFVSGHPGTTNRMETVARLIRRRDRGHPYALAQLRAMEAALAQFSERGPDERRMTETDLHQVANARKAVAGQYQGLLDPKVMEQKREQEKQLRQAGAAAGNAWDEIERAQDQFAAFAKEYALLEQQHALFSDLFLAARHLVRLSAELPKPSGTRLREYRDSNLESLKLELFSTAPIEPALEKAKLTAAMTFLAEQLGGQHPLTQVILAGKPPHLRAAELVSGCKLFEVAERRKLFDGGAAAISGSDDPMIRLAVAVDPAAREFRQRFESEVEEPERQAYAKIAKVRFAQLGRSVPPDATFTLRLAYGVVRGYQVDGVAIPFCSTIGGLFERATKQQQREPFDLPERWQKAQRSLNPATPFNFVSTADTIGGNSGSPVLNRAGELVGINFDRNRYGLIRNFVYTDVQARHIAVHGQAVIEALRTVYGAAALADELQAK